MIVNDPVYELVVTGPSKGGKSSVISTLTEDDSIRISPLSAETSGGRDFPVRIDGRVVIRFVETPGFKDPYKTLAWCRNYNGPDNQRLNRFIHAHRDHPFFKTECELMKRIARGGTVLYVVDGSHPVDGAHRAAMEILRLTCHPRMALINCKSGRDTCMGAWKKELSRYFTTTCILDAHCVGYRERMNLLESIGAMEQGCPDLFHKVISAFRMNWNYRRVTSAALICELLYKTLNHYETIHLADDAEVESAIKRVEDRYWKRIDEIEKEILLKIQYLYRHHDCHVDLPIRVAAGGGLLSKKTWNAFGLSPTKLALATFAVGGVLGACINLAASPDNLFSSSTAGSALGAGTALFFGKKLSKLKVSGLSLGDTLITVGPNRNICFLYEVLDRALMFYSYIINRAHGCRETPRAIRDTGLKGDGACCFTSSRDKSRERVCTLFQQTISSKIPYRQQIGKNRLIGLLNDMLSEIS